MQVARYAAAMQCKLQVVLLYGERTGASSKSSDQALTLCTTRCTGTCGTSQVTSHSEIQREPMAQQEDPTPLCAWTVDIKAHRFLGSGSLVGSTQLDLKLVLCDSTMIKALSEIRYLRLCYGKSVAEPVRKTCLTVSVVC